ncbi:hypothetical protein M0R04_00635 [Candidatus Dojkabacteria bacterium]|jgi:hypothetical protein|nr:hypothetical protein [Candidatus Dojkabacteria bacterium]
MRFNNKWDEFVASDKFNKDVLNRDNNVIYYSHKSWVPEKTNDKPSLLMIFGNPAPHSVKDDIYFSYEGGGTEHRFWKIMRELGIIDISTIGGIKENFFNLKYESPFRLGLEVIYTFPSSASSPKWSGVAGLERLFGKKAMNKMAVFEKARLQNEIDNFMIHSGAIIVFQKNAWNILSNDMYDLKLALNGNLRSMYNNIPMVCVPPTRWLYTTKMKDLLTVIKEQILTK